MTVMAYQRFINGWLVRFLLQSICDLRWAHEVGTCGLYVYVSAVDLIHGFGDIRFCGMICSGVPNQGSPK